MLRWCLIRSVVEEVLNSFAKVKVLISNCSILSILHCKTFFKYKN